MTKTEDQAEAVGRVGCEAVGWGGYGRLGGMWKAGADAEDREGSIRKTAPSREEVICQHSFLTVPVRSIS